MDFRIAPVEVGLLHVKVVVVVLACLVVPLPCGVAKTRLPGVGRGAGGGGGLAVTIFPPVPVALGIVAGGARLLEPGMLVRGVVDDVIHEDADATLLRFGDEGVEVSHGSIFGIDGGVVGNIVAVVYAR